MTWSLTSVRSSDEIDQCPRNAQHDVQTRVLVQAVRRHLARFPDDFMFHLTKDEFDDLRSQSVISSG